VLLVFAVICLLEGSGKWPEDIEAVRRLKASYYADLGKSLNKTADGLLTAAFTDHLDVYKVCHASVTAFVLRLLRCTSVV
jgi:hypothetical protein